MGRIVINKVTYKGEKFSFESPPFVGGLNIIEGRNGNGKSTLMNLIYFALGGKVDEFSPNNSQAHKEVTEDRNGFVSLDLSIDDIKMTFIRNIDSNDITILSDKEVARALPIYRSKNEKLIFSDWMLSALNIEPVEIFQGINVSKINFRDLLRLVYHNQELNPKKIYKPADSENFVSDSELVRKIIFELLVGKSYGEFYSSLARLKEKERERSTAKAVLDVFIASSKLVDYKGDDMNLVFLREAVLGKGDQLAKLYLYRESIKNEKRPRSKFQSETNELKAKILENELSLSGQQRSYHELSNEMLKLKRLRENVILEVTQISKIIHAHEKLSLFSADTCPYCLRSVSRATGHCVCGNEVTEEQYERFFYSSEEYADILKSKQKSIDTIDVAIESCQAQLIEVSTQIESLNKAINSIQNDLSEWIGKYDFNGNDQELSRADDTILEVKTEIGIFNQRIEIESRREMLSKKYQLVNNDYEKLRDEVKVLEGRANGDIKRKVDEFNVIYNYLMTNTLKECRSATIGYDDYMPIIDGGVYKEASASVTIRIMYYFTLLKLSLENQDVKFPKILLIDTPETAGVDSENLKRAIGQVSYVTKGFTESNYQIILTTGIGKYPDEYKKSVIISLDDANKLLAVVPNQE